MDNAFCNTIKSREVAAVPQHQSGVEGNEDHHSITAAGDVDKANEFYNRL